MQPLLVVDLLQELADRACALRPGPGTRCDSTSSYLSVFMNDSQAALSQGLPLRDMLMCDAVILQQIRVVGAGVL